MTRSRITAALFTVLMLGAFCSEASQILVTERDVPYQERPAKVTLDVHSFKNPQQLRPALVMIHGGAFRGAGAVRGGFSSPPRHKRRMPFPDCAWRWRFDRSLRSVGQAC